MSHRTIRPCLLLPIVLSGLALLTSQPDAALEEFENWSVAARELDDENGLDDLHRSPTPIADWRWREFENGARVGMGCATTEVWELNLDAKLYRLVSGRVAAAFRLHQQQELGEEVNWTEFTGAYRPVGGLWLGAGYRPAFEKEQHDAALYSEYRQAWTRWIRFRLGFDDALNNFWDDRTRYIEDRERRVYTEQPVEYEFSTLWRRDAGRGINVRAVYLPTYEREFTPAPTSIQPGSVFRGNGWLLYTDLVSAEGRAGVVGLRFRHKGTDRETTYLPSENLPDTMSVDHASLRDTYVRPWADIRLANRWRFRTQLQARWSSETHFDGMRDHILETSHAGGHGHCDVGRGAISRYRDRCWGRLRQREPGFRATVRL